MTCTAAICLAAFLIVDGDTLKQESPGKTLYWRLWGIDAPEADTPSGPVATAALRALADGRTLACDLMDVDRYGRPVVRCDLPDGRDLACALVAAGAAVDWPRYSGGAYRDCGED